MSNKKRQGSLKIYLRRIRIREKSCDGYLCLEDGRYICDTAEATPYMLDPGDYTLTTRTHVIQKGNGVYNLHKPTIYVGTHLVPGVVKWSALAYNRLYQRFKKARQRKKEIILVIE